MAKRKTSNVTAAGKNEGRKLIAYCVNKHARMPLIAATSNRPWMDETDRRFVYRCLPLLIANQAGWFLLNNQIVRAIWNGGDSPNSLEVKVLSGEEPCSAVSHFGYGILTWHVPYIFRTPAGYNLLVRGPANWPKDGACPLEGLVETDWAEATFTVNWKLTRVRQPVTFQQGEPIAMILPQKRGELESFQPEIRDIAQSPELKQGFEHWSRDRDRFLKELKAQESEAQKEGWQKHYFVGTRLKVERVEEHQTKLKLMEFKDSQDAV